jgi:hypothetical protein
VSNLPSLESHRTGIGSGAWLVMFRSGSYIDEENGVLHQWSRHLKVQAIPEGAYLDEGIWYGKNG